MKLFGFEIKRSFEDGEKNIPVSFAEPQNDDGAITVGNALGGFYGTMLDMEGTAKTESELVTKYRGMALQPEIAQAVDEVVNEAISVDSYDNVVEIVLDDVDMPDKVKKRVTEEFQNILSLLDFSNTAYDLFSRFYVDGRINFHIIIDEKDLKRGVTELRYVDPRKIKLIREIDKRNKDDSSGVPTKRVKNEYYLYSDTGFGNNSTNVSTVGGMSNTHRISKDSVARVTSGLMNESNSLVLSHLHPAIKPLNQLRMLEDATVIYTLTRAPERRIFYIDVGNLPKAKAEQYLRDMMVRHKNKLQYNSSTGEITDARKMMTMTEDFWFPRRGGERSTEVDVMAGGSAAGLSDDTNMQYFQRKLYKSLKVPVSRLEPETMATFGRTSEITRDELKFGKFIRRVRTRFSGLFDIILEKQLILKGIMGPEEFNEIKNNIRYDFMKDNYFEELKQSEIIRERMSTLRDMEDQIGVFYSRKWVVKNILQMSEEEFKEEREQIELEKEEFGSEEDDMSTPEKTPPPEPPSSEPPDPSEEEDDV